MATVLDSLAAKVTLLRLINDVPDRPSFNAFLATAEDNRRVLPVRHEASITQQLAFLSAYSDDPAHTTAVCIEELHDGSGLVIRVAVNSGAHEMLHDGLGRIVEILRHHARKENDDQLENSEALLRTAVKLNYWRILTRMRSRHMKSRKSERKVNLLQRLSSAVKILQESPSPSVRLPGLVEEVDLLRKDFDRLEEMTLLQVQLPAVEECLLAMVKRIHAVFSRYEQELATIHVPARKVWTGKSTEALLDRLKKIGQYVVACEELLKAARRYEIFKAARLEFLGGFQQHSRPWDTVGDMNLVIDDLCNPEFLLRIPRRPGKPAVVSCEAVKSRMSTMTSFLHSEIQLALFYEQNDGLIPPRVICASKSACYLCNLFLKVQGKYTIPSCHGKLYDAWIWPKSGQTAGGAGQEGDWLCFRHLLPKFEAEIDQKIQESLETPKLGKRIEPLESTVDLIRVITPSSESSASQDADRSQSLLGIAFTFLSRSIMIFGLQGRIKKTKLS